MVGRKKAAERPDQQLWVQPRRIRYLRSLDPPSVRALKRRLVLVSEQPTRSLLWYCDRESGQLWKCTIELVDVWESETLEPVLHIDSQEFRRD